MALARSENVAVPLSAATTRYGSAPSWHTTPASRYGIRDARRRSGRPRRAEPTRTACSSVPARLPGLRVDGSPTTRVLLHDEHALGAGGHDHRVLHRLGLDEAEDLGAVVVEPVRPTQAPAGHQAVAAGAGPRIPVRRRRSPTVAEVGASRRSAVPRLVHEVRGHCGPGLGEYASCVRSRCTRLRYARRTRSVSMCDGRVDLGASSSLAAGPCDVSRSGSSSLTAATPPAESGLEQRHHRLWWPRDCRAVPR